MVIDLEAFDQEEGMTELRLYSLVNSQSGECKE